MTILTVNCVAIRLFAFSLNCVVWPEESLRVIGGLGVRAGKGWGGVEGWFGFLMAILTVHRVAVCLFAFDLGSRRLVR